MENDALSAGSGKCQERRFGGGGSGVGYIDGGAEGGEVVKVCFKVLEIKREVEDIGVGIGGSLRGGCAGGGSEGGSGERGGTEGEHFAAALDDDFVEELCFEICHVVSSLGNAEGWSLCSCGGEDAGGAAGEEAALGDADRRRSVDDMVNLIDIAGEGDGVGCIRQDDGAGRQGGGGQSQRCFY